MVVKVAGELDLATAPILADALVRLCPRVGELVVNLEQVEFMDCAGLRVLTDVAELGNVHVSFTPGPPQVQRLFELTGMREVFRIIPPPRPYEDQAAA